MKWFLRRFIAILFIAAMFVLGTMFICTGIIFGDGVSEKLFSLLASLMFYSFGLFITILWGRRGLGN